MDYTQSVAQPGYGPAYNNNQNAEAGYRAPANDYAGRQQQTGIRTIYAAEGADLFVPEVNQIVIGGEKLAYKILNAGADRAWNAPRQAPVNVSYVDNSWNWNTYNSYGRNDDNRGAAVTVGVLASIAGVVTAYFVGEESRRLKDATHGLNKVQGMQRSLEYVQENPSEDQHLLSLHRILGAERRIFSSIKESSQRGLVVKLALGGSLLLTGVSLFIGASGLATIGLVGTIIAAVGLALKAGYEDLQRDNKAQARIIQREVNFLNQRIQGHEEERGIGLVEEPAQTDNSSWFGWVLG